MGSGGASFNDVSDLYDIYHTVQNTLIRYPKEAIIYSLRQIFAQDSYYRFSKDVYGYALTPDHTDLNVEAGLFDNTTTRVYISEPFHEDVIYYPAILVKHGGARYKPLSLNRDQYSVMYKTVTFTDDSGNERQVQQPDKFVIVGAWEGTINIDILSRSVRSRDDLAQIITLAMTDWQWNDLSNSGVSIKPTANISAPSESEDRNNKLFKCTLTLDIWTEFRREIPISNVMDSMQFCIELGREVSGQFIPAPNLTITTDISILDAFQPTT